MCHHGAKCSFHVHQRINLSSICSMSGHRCPGNFWKTSWKFRKFTFSDWFYFPEIYFLRLVFISRIFLSDRLWSGEHTTSHGNFLRIFFCSVHFVKQVRTETVVIDILWGKIAIKVGSFLAKSINLVPTSPMGQKKFLSYRQSTYLVATFQKVAT
jgi:hypothetical protein